MCNGRIRQRNATVTTSKELSDAFDNADFYTCIDPDRLILESPDEAIMEWLDRHRMLGRSVLDLINNHTPITVMAFKRSQVSDLWIESTAEWLLDQAADSFFNEYGSPDVNDNDDIDDDDIKRAMPSMKAAVKQLVESTTVWQREQVASRNFDTDQVTAMMREKCPRWFTSDRETVDADKQDQASR